MTEINNETQVTLMPEPSAAEMPTPTKKCTYCDTTMSIHARVCANCNRDQKWYLNYFRIGDLLLLASILISFGMVYFAYRNFHESREERVKASQALDVATRAEGLVAQGKQQLQQLQESNEEGRKEVVKIKNFVADAEGKLKAVSEELERAKTTVDNLEALTTYMSLVIDAQNDDRKAYDKLSGIAEDERNPLSDKAKNAWLKIREQHSQPMYLSGFQVPWKEGIDPSRLNIKEIEQNIVGAPANIRVMLAEYVSKRTDFKKEDKLALFARLIERDDNLKVVEYAGRYFVQEAGLKYIPLATKEILEWWDKNKSNIK